MCSSASYRMMIVTVDVQVDGRMAQSWNSGGPRESLTDIKWVRPAGSILSTVNDMNKFIDSFVMTVQNMVLCVAASKGVF